MELAPHITRNLCDKFYDKRKLGALEIERMVKDMNTKNEFDKIDRLTSYVIETFCSSSNGNHRKGGLIALAGIAIGLGADVHKLVDRLAPPVLKMFIDQDSRVRYYACEAMYNISKVLSQSIVLLLLLLLQQQQPLLHSTKLLMPSSCCSSDRSCFSSHCRS
jgi:vacuole morphology and inheritance protein 14